MKKLYLLISFAVICLDGSMSLYSGGVSTGVEVDSSDDDDDSYYEDNVIWVGPGWYYGVWFDSEDNFYGWRRDHGYWHGNDGHYHGHGGGNGNGHGGGGHGGGNAQHPHGGGHAGGGGHH